MKKRVQIFIPLISALLLAGCGKPPTLPPGGFAAHAQLDKTVIAPGEQAVLTVTARHPKGAVTVFPEIGTGKRIVVKHRNSEQRLLTEEIQETEAVIELTSFRIGTWNITTNPVVCTFADGTEKRQALADLTLTVKGVLTAEDQNKISDIRDIAKPRLWISPKLWVPLLIALLALLAGLITVFLFRRRESQKPAAPPEPPQVIARRALDQLKNKEWVPEPFFTELSFILRTYLEGRFHLNAPDLTTEELTRKMASDDRLDTPSKQSLENFMTQADLVKFARAGAEQGVMQNAFTTVENFVDQTSSKEDLPQEIAKNSKTEGDG